MLLMTRILNRIIVLLRLFVPLSCDGDLLDLNAAGLVLKLRPNAEIKSIQIWE